MTLSNQQLEENYNFRLKVPDADICIKQWQEASEKARSELSFMSDIPYGDQPRQLWDFFPAKDKNAPFLIFIHGGYWQSQVKESFHFIAENYVKSGISVGFITYRLCPDVAVSDCINDVRTGIAALPKLLSDHDIHPKNYTVSGHSVGGNMTSWMVGESLQQHSPLPKMAKGIGLSGVYEVWPLVPTTVNNRLGMTEEEARRNSPVLQDFNWQEAQMILSCGGDETQDLHRQQDDYLALIQSQGGVAIECDAAGRHHFDILFDFCNPDHALFQKSCALIKSDI